MSQHCSRRSKQFCRPLQGLGRVVTQSQVDKAQDAQALQQYSKPSPQAVQSTILKVCALGSLGLVASPAHSVNRHRPFCCCRLLICISARLFQFLPRTSEIRTDQSRSQHSTPSKELLQGSIPSRACLSEAWQRGLALTWSQQWSKCVLTSDVLG